MAIIYLEGGGGTEGGVSEGWERERNREGEERRGQGAIDELPGVSV